MRALLTASNGLAGPNKVSSAKDITDGALVLAAARRATWVLCAFVAHQRRWARPLSRPGARPAAGRALGAAAGRALGAAAGLSVALTIALTAAGCTSAPAGTARTGPAGRPAVTLAQARQVWDRYVAVSGAQVIKTGNPAPALALETGPQHAYDAATDSSALLA